MVALMNSKKETTQALADLARAGDRTAFEKLTDSCRDRLATLVRFRLGPSLRRHADPEDLLQETYLRAFQCIDRFEWRSQDSFFQWLSGIARRVILERCRTTQHSTAEPQADEPAGDHVSPSRAIRREERWGRLQSALDQLSPEYRRVLRGVLVEKLPLTEIARRMGRTPNAISILLPVTPWRETP